MEYKVTWEIELDAESPREAAQLARKIHLDPESYATVFKVVPVDMTIDLSENA